MAIKHILFDLDGTLLPMVQDEFVRFYMPLLAKAYLKKGVEMDPKGFIGAVWKGYEAMVKNDGSKTNREAFWSYIDEFLPLSVEESEAIADAFYEDEFNQAKCTTQPTPLVYYIPAFLSYSRKSCSSISTSFSTLFTILPLSTYFQ